jgi:hypothetical protein
MIESIMLELSYNLLESIIIKYKDLKKFLYKFEHFYLIKLF